MTEIFNNVHGFNLKLPLNTTSRQYPDQYGEWIEIIKKPNQLPTVKLKTIVLYYRENITDYDSGDKDIPSGTSGGNYRFYNNTSGGRQLGWIWGFPLFDVRGGGWPKFESCLTSPSDICGNETMLVDLSPNKNIIVLDCSGLQPSSGKGTNDISNNISHLSGAFFMILRIKSSKETDFSNYKKNKSTRGKGERGNWNLYDDTTQETKKWASLVQYEYECDIIGPKGMLDFTFDYFMVNDNSIGRPIYQIDSSTSKPNYLAIPNSTYFNYSRENSCKIITGLQTGSANDNTKRMDITNILSNLSGINGGTGRLQVKENWNKLSSSTVVKLIGGWYSDNSGTDLSNCYYGDNFDGPGFTTEMSSTGSHMTEGWKKFIKLSTTGTNKWVDKRSDSIYELNNILWCSLQSPRKLPVTKYDGSWDLQRYITNWVVLSGGDTSNEITGGGYGMYPNTIDLPRKSKNPYYSKDVAGNDDTVSISDFILNRPCYFDASTEPNITLDDLNYFRVYYKLLIPPDDNTKFQISFTTGKTSSSVTTFVRHNDMDGDCIPPGINNKNAKRDEETITLTWDNNSFDTTTSDISMQSIYFTDVASGFKKIDASFNCTDTRLNFIVTDISKNYDISFNVFQLNFFEKIGNNIFSDRDEIPYTDKIFNTKDPSSQGQVVDISYVPVNYTPYRYLNYNIDNLGLSIESNRYFKKGTIYQDKIVIPEKLSLNVSKLYINNNIDGENATIIQPGGDKNLTEKIIDISGVYDNSYSFFKSDTTSTNSDTAIIISGNNNTLTIDNKVDAINTDDFPDVGDILNRTSYFGPLSLQLGNYFIPDYWRLPSKINTLRRVKRLFGNTVEYTHLDSWENQIKISMVIDIFSLSLKSGSLTIANDRITHILINSLKDSAEYTALTQNGQIMSSTDNLIFTVTGALNINPESYLNKSPIIVELKIENGEGPFGPTGKKYIGETEGETGINVPFPEQSDISANSNNFIVDTILLPTMRRGNGISGEDLSLYDSSYNGIFDVRLKAADDISNNNAFKGFVFLPESLNVLLVELPEIYQTNKSIDDMLNDENSTITIKWSSFYFSNDDTWDTSTSDVYWTISRYNISSNESEVILSDKQVRLKGGEYIFIDTGIRIYEKLRYTVTGKFRWKPIANINGLELNIEGFITPVIFICKNNRFPYGRYNTSSTNLKLFRPLLINTTDGQVDQFGKKTAGGGCFDVNTTNLYASGSRISSSNNIYANTSDTISKKQTYVILSKSINRPKR
uniref:Uncharacterized protein n=1 Tax=viral metagenome TaxID=1070528 RepID=A0A6C0JD22_9ZZZZ